MEAGGGRLLEELRGAVQAFDPEAVRLLCRRALDGGVEPLRVFEALREVITRVGEDFSADRIFLPELVGASKAMEAGMGVVQQALARGGGAGAPAVTVALGTVQGDIHNIGKNIVAALLAAAGVQVIDLGIDVPAARFLEAAGGGGGGGRPADVLALSALLTTTAAEQRKVIERVEAAGLRGRVRIIVGGGAISQEFADQIGADGYGSTAPDAVRLVRELAGEGGRGCR